MGLDPGLTEPILLVRPSPRRYEGPLGYLLRLAEQNCLNLADLTKMGLGFSYNGLTSHGLLGAQVVDPALHAAVQNIASLVESEPRIWNRQVSRYCPLCLMDDPIWQASWELLFCDACPTHSIWLVDQCSSCGQDISWHRESLLRCDCGSDLRTEPARECPQNVAQLSHFLKARVENVSHETLPHIEKLSIEQMQRLVRFIGGYLDPAAGPKPLKLRKSGVLTVSWPVTTLAAETIYNWPQAFLAALDRLQDLSSEQKVGLREALGQAHHYLYKGLPEPSFTPIRSQFETWVADRWRGGVAARNRRLPSEILENAVWVPSNEATARLGISVARLRSLVSEGVIDGEEKVSVSGRRFLTVRKDQLDKITSQIAGELDMQGAVEALGLGKIRMRQLLLLVFPTAHRVTDGVSAPWSVPRNEVEALLNLGANLPKFNVPDENQVALSHVLRFWNWTAEEIVGLIEDARSSAVSIKGLLTSARGVGQWIFDIKELKAWHFGCQKQLPHWLSVDQAAKALRIHQQVTYWLVHSQFIHAEKVPGKKGVCYRISRTELENFAKNYVSCKQVAGDMLVSPRKAKSILGLMGVYPISGVGADVCRQLFYKRTENLERALSEYHSGMESSRAGAVGKSDLFENSTDSDPARFDKGIDSSGP